VQARNQRLAVLGVLGLLTLGSTDGQATHSFRIRPVFLDVPPATAVTASAGVVEAIRSCDFDALSAAVFQGTAIPTIRPQDDKADECVVLGQLATEERLFLGPSEFGARWIKSARAEFNEGEGWAVTLRFTKRGAERFDRMAVQYIQQRLALVVDSVVASAPTVQSKFFGGTAQITGDFSHRDAKRLASTIRQAMKQARAA
jgi:preprotein translocase subunit SecD